MPGGAGESRPESQRLRGVPGTRVAHKDGTVSDARTDAGILYLPGGPVAVCVLTAKNEDKAWKDDNAANVLIGRIAQQVLEHYANPKKKK